MLSLRDIGRQPLDLITNNAMLNRGKTNAVTLEKPLPILNAEDLGEGHGDVSGEAVSWQYISGTAWASATGQAASTLCTAKLLNRRITNSIKASLGGNVDSSLSFAAATRAATKVSVSEEDFSRIAAYSPVDQAVAMALLLPTAGNYAVDHTRGQVWMNSLAVVAADSVSYSFFLKPSISRGIEVVKTDTLDGNGAQVDNIFKFTGSVECVIFGICTEATSAAVLSTSSWDAYDGTNTVVITAAAGTDLSGAVAGSAIVKKAAAATALSLSNASQVRIQEGASLSEGALYPFVLTAKAGVTNYIRFNFTGNGATDTDMEFHVIYKPLSKDGVVLPV